MKKTAGNMQDLFKKEIPKMPQGYYSGDKPNQNLRAFVEQHVKENPYNPETDDYDVPPFDKPIETTKATAIYNMHTYWSKKPHDAIRQYIRHYTKPSDLVLDPFCGSGGTNLAALMEGRKTIAIDRSPAATFITKNYCTPVDVDELQKAFEELKREVKAEIDWLYETRCDRCGGKATTAYTVYSQVFQCPRCLEKVPLFDCVEVDGETAKGKPKKISVCPGCHMRNIIEPIDTRERLGSIPVLVSYLCENGCHPARSERRHNDSNKKKREYFQNYDLKKMNDIETSEIRHWYPTHRMMNVPEKQRRWALLWRQYHGDIVRVCDFYTKRNLAALSVILEGIRSLKKVSHQDTLLFAFTSILLKASRMMGHNSDGIGRIQKGTYYLPQILHDVHVWKFFFEAISDMLAGYRTIQNAGTNLQISTQDARHLNLASSSVDYIFTDPPYADKVQYGELNFVWEAWLDLDTHWHDDEIIVNELRGKTESDWEKMMRSALSECYRVLKPGRCISLCYHDTSEGTWAIVQDLMAEVGFVPERTESVLYIDTKTKTTNQYFADKVNKRDLLINFRKSKPGEVTATVAITGDEDETTFNEKVRQIIRDYISLNPGSTKDHVYDEVVSRMVRAGRMEPHDFEGLLRQVADEIREPIRKDLFRNEDPNLFGTHEISRWYLKESQMDIVDTAESAKEDAAADKVGEFVEKYLKEHPEKEGVHYSDIFEHFIYTVKDKPRRPLAEWLLDYFYKTDEGTYRLPISEEERKHKAESRSKGTNRRIKRYIVFLDQGVAIPEKERPNDATLSEWIRHCKRSGLYEQGKLLYERGGLIFDTLPEEAQVNVEEDYQTCIRMLNRTGKKVK